MSGHNDETKSEEEDDEEIEITETTSPSGSRWTSLDGLEERVNERYRLQREKIAIQHAKRETERAHSRFIRSRMGLSPVELSKARHVVSGWKKKHELSSLRHHPGPRFPIPAHIPQASASASASSASRPTIASVRGSTDSSTAVVQPATVSRMDTSASGSETSPIPVRDPPLFVEREIHRCHVLNCQIQFEDEQLFTAHQREGYHNPCNPFLHLVNGELKQGDTATFVCPVCNATFQSPQSCHEHIESSSHGAIARPLRVAAYACPQCLLPFPEFIACRLHMDKAGHNRYLYPYADDATGTDAIEPIALPFKMLAAYRKQCQKTAWTLECLDCSRQLDHTDDDSSRRCSQHVLMAMCEQTPAEAFAFLLRHYTCAMCLRLIENLPPEGICAPHQCGQNMVGLIIDNDCKTFQEFVCRFSLPEDSVEKEILDLARHETNGTRKQSVHVDDSDKDYCVPIPSTSSCIPKVTPEHSRERGFLGLDGEVKNRDLLPHSASSTNGKRKILEKDSEVRCLENPIKKHRVEETVSCVQPDSEDELLPRRQTPDGEEMRLGEIQSDRQTAPENVGAKMPVAIVPPNRVSPQVSTSFRSTGHHHQPFQQRSSSDESKTNSVSPSLGHLSSEFAQTGLRPSRERHHTGQSTATTSWPRSEERRRCYSEEPSAESLSTMKQLVFLDLDNWISFFQKLRGPLPEKTFVWGFHGGSTIWRIPNCVAFRECERNGCFYLQPRSGHTKNASDFALCLVVGRMDVLLPKSVPFTILSGDKGFLELQRQMELSQRRAVVIDPHRKTTEEVYVLINSVADV